jgi:hypothetical protein
MTASGELQLQHFKIALSGGLGPFASFGIRRSRTIATLGKPPKLRCKVMVKIECKVSDMKMKFSQ